MISSYLQGDRRPTLVVLLLLIVFFGVGIAGHIYQPTFDLMMALTPWVLFIAGAIVFASGIARLKAIDYLWFVGTYLITFTLEALGTATGHIFGAYDYGPVLGFSLFEVPVVIGFNWVMVVLGAIGLAGLMTRSLEGRRIRPLVDSLLAAVIAVGFDYVLEPLAMSLGYWNWTGGEIPTQNYVAWFVIALVFALAHRLLRAERGRTMVTAYFFVQLAFFGALRLGGL